MPNAECRILTAGRIVILACVVLTSGCAASRAFRHGQEAVHNADWDSAVAYFTTAVQANPDNTEYKINLKRAQEEAARMHVERARELEKKDQLDSALAEYRKSLDLIGSDRLVRTKVADLERTIRERIDASRPLARIDQLKNEARSLNAPPLLNPSSQEPIRLNSNNSSLRDILNFIGTASGINITYDQQYVDKPYTVNIDGVTVQEALNQVLSANGYYYKVTNQRTIIVIPDQPAKHQQYDELVVKVFFISHADATELAQLVNSIMRIPQMAVQPMLMPNKTANTITVRATAPVVDVMERVIRANDKPRAEVVLDVEILEVNRNRVKRYGINLTSYSLNLLFSPELAPPNTTAVSAPPPFNLNTISQGINTADFYLGVPTAVVNFLESDQHTKTLAKPQLRGAEGTKMTLNLGSEIPVISTVFGAAAAGGFATIPQSSFNYRKVGVNLDITPRVTYEGEIILDLTVENSALGASVDVGGQSAPSFLSRQVTTHLRLREGEANLLAGMIKTDNTNNHSGLPGIMRIPGIRHLFSNNDTSEQDTDIVMLITPHIVRDHELTREDVGSIYIGTQANVGLGGPPPLIAPQPEAPPAPPAAPPTPQSSATTGMPNAPQAGAQGPPVAGPPGAQQTNVPAPPGTSPLPGALPPSQTQPIPGVSRTTPPGTPPPVTPPATPPTGTVTPPGTTPVPPAATTPPLVGTTPPVAGTTPPPVGTTPPTGATTPPSATAAQIIITPPGTEFRVAGGPYTVPISINNASRVSTISLTLTYNPGILRVRTVQDGLFMRQGGVTASFMPRPDATQGRVDIVISRTGDQTGASGTGLLSAVLFDAVAPGTTTITVAAVASAPDGTPVQLVTSPVTVIVR
jgi:general secretion pathway protein D